MSHSRIGSLGLPVRFVPPPEVVPTPAVVPVGEVVLAATAEPVEAGEPPTGGQVLLAAEAQVPPDEIDADRLHFAHNDTHPQFSLLSDNVRHVAQFVQVLGKQLQIGVEPARFMRFYTGPLKIEGGKN